MTHPLRSPSLRVAIVVNILGTLPRPLNKTAGLGSDHVYTLARLSKFARASCASRALFLLLAQFFSVVAFGNHPLMFSLRPILHRSTSHLMQLFPYQILSIICLVGLTRLVVDYLEKLSNFVPKLRISI